MGYVKTSTVIQKKSMTDELRNSLWNDFHRMYDEEWDNSWGYGHNKFISNFSKLLYEYYFKKPIDELPGRDRDKLEIIKKHFFECKWNEVYDFLEFLCSVSPQGKIADSINVILKRELSAYRLIEGRFAPITDEQEIKALKEALVDDQFKGVQEHLKTALKILSDREEPNKRNSIKESISAVESICKEIAGKEKATLGDALKILGKQGKIHNALKEGFIKLYGYTNDAGGIRHAIMAESNIDADLAKYFLLSCTSFINYLKTKI